MEPDGLPVRDSGEWVKRKHHFLARYCRLFTVGMKYKWDGNLNYIDLMAGPGRCRIEETGEIVRGSPFVALEENFAHYDFFEEDPELAHALKARVAAHKKGNRCIVHAESWDHVVLRNAFPRHHGLTLAFVDPTGIRSVPWAALEQLTRNYKNLDILMTIQHAMAIKLNRPQYLAREDRTAADMFLGSATWREKVTGPGNYLKVFLDTFVQNFSDHGFRTRNWMLVKNNRSPLYYVCLFARHERALDFWDKAVAEDEAGQRNLGL